MKLDANKKLIIILCCAAVIVGMIFISAFVPLLKKIKLDQQQLASIEANLNEMESRINAVRGIDEKKLDEQLKTLESILPKKQQMANALKEITELGTSYNIEFISITPQKTQNELEEKKEGADGAQAGSSAAEYQKLPIQLELSCEYENCGKFLQALMNMKNNLVTVEDLEIKAEEGKLPNLLINLNIQVYALIGKNNG